MEFAGNGCISGRAGAGSIYGFAGEPDGGKGVGAARWQNGLDRQQRGGPGGANPAERKELPRIVVWGEARKGTIWAGCFGRGEGIGVSQEGDWKLLPSNSRGEEWPQTKWVEPGRVPQAEWVGRLFFSGREGEERQPIYLHPAVTAAPRFDAEGRPLA